ncbi:MAG TPA: CT583 family protein [Rhabdochlamydiaceae bacterium]|nr:CT583 family protein [Rhabdochlamydiaceae bacterium]
MSKVNELLTSRLKQKATKMTELAEIASRGNLSSFAGVFKINPLTSEERDDLEALLHNYKIEEEIDDDLRSLASLTSEIKAINNQAAILHGERIKKAQAILKKYRDGAFSAWLISIYGNRQTPYNFLQYYEFYLQLPQTLHAKLDEIPRQAVYTLASRDAPFEKKASLLKNYRGETKNQVLNLIRKTFPLAEKDGRKEDLAFQAITTLKRLVSLFEEKRFRPSKGQKETITKLLKTLQKTNGQTP